ncbi:MAG: hypothetical protein Q4G04_02550 [bacterium]|nr:hypothetical protein [bacterium]
MILIILVIFRKSYEKHALSYAINVSDEKTLQYAIMLFKAEYELLIDPFKDNLVVDLQNELSKRIKGISSSIVKKKLNKGIVFKTTRNFVILEKRKYGIRVRLSNVEDNENVLKEVGRGSYDHLCKYYNVINYADIEKILPYVRESFELTKYNINDVKSGIYKMYANK